MLTFCNSSVLWLLRCVQVRLVTVTLSDVYVTWCYVLWHYQTNTFFLFSPSFFPPSFFHLSLPWLLSNSCYCRLISSLPLCCIRPNYSDSSFSFLVLLLPIPHFLQGATVIVSHSCVLLQLSTPRRLIYTLQYVQNETLSTIYVCLSLTIAALYDREGLGGRDWRSRVWRDYSLF